MYAPMLTQPEHAVHWQNYACSRQRQNVAGKAATLLLMLVMLLLVDGLQALMRSHDTHLDLLAGESARISGPLGVENPVAGDIEAVFQPSDAPLLFVPDGFFSGYWLGNSMWRGVVQAPDRIPFDGPSATYSLELTFRRAPQQLPQSYTVTLWANAAAMQAAAPSFFYRYTGLNAFAVAAVLAFLGLLCGSVTYCLGRRAFTSLEALDCREIFRVSADRPARLCCLAGMHHGLRRGNILMLLDKTGQPAGTAKVLLQRKNVLELVVQTCTSPSHAIAVGFLVHMRPLAAISQTRTVLAQAGVHSEEETA